MSINETCQRCHGWVWHRTTPCNCKLKRIPKLTSAAFMKAFSSRLKSLRNAQGLSLDELSARAGMSKTGLWQIENCRSEPMALTVIALAEALDVSPNDMLLSW